MFDVCDVGCLRHALIRCSKSWSELESDDIESKRIRSPNGCFDVSIGFFLTFLTEIYFNSLCNLSK